MLERPTKADDKPNSPGFYFERQSGKYYRVFKFGVNPCEFMEYDQDDGFRAINIRELPPGDYVPLAPPVTLSEAKKELHEWISQNMLGSGYGPLVDKAAELFGRLQTDDTTAELEHWLRATEIAEVPDLKATIGRLEGEVAKAAKPKVVVELPQGSAVEFAKVWWTEWRGDDLHVCVSVDAPQPEVIIGKGQAEVIEDTGAWLTPEQKDLYLRASPDGTITLQPLGPGDKFWRKYRYMRCPTFPPRPTFTPPPKPDMLIRHKAALRKALERIRPFVDLDYKTHDGVRVGEIIDAALKGTNE